MLRHTFPTPNRLSLAILTISLGIGIDGIPVALAQGASLEEVIVTARKRDENLMDIPESVSAIGAAEVERRNIKGLNKIGLAVPNLNLSMRTDGYPNVTIRGVGAYGMTQGVGFYLDDVQLFSDASSRFGDIERIEVLKGPQGVLYGGSNIGGAVKYVSKTPSTEEMGGRLKVLAGEQGIWDIEGDINVPLSDKWALRAFAFTREDDGFMTNPGSLSPVFGVDYNQPEDVGAYEQSGGRLVYTVTFRTVSASRHRRDTTSTMAQLTIGPGKWVRPTICNIPSLWIPTLTRLMNERHLERGLRSMLNSIISTSRASRLTRIPRAIVILMST